MTELGTLQTNMTTLADPTLYDSRTSSVSDPAVASATVAAGASIGTYTFDITQLATASKRVGASNVGGTLNTSNPLTTAGFATDVTAGTFSVNGQQVNIATTDSLDAVFTKISDATGGTVTASYDSTNDKIVLNSSSEIVLSSATDTSNFLQVAKLNNNGGNSVTSSNALGGVISDTTIAQSNLSTPVTNGTPGPGQFKINGVAITYDVNTDSIANVLARINNSTAGVTASYDATNDRFQLTSKSTGDMNIAVEEDSGNFLTATGLSTTGSTPSTLVHGKNLLYTVNGGDQLVSQSNTITSDSSGIAGLSLTVLTNNSTASVSIASDNSKIESAVSDFVNQYNRVQSLITTDTASTTSSTGVVTAGILASDHDASSLAESLRTLVFSPVSGLSGTLSHLADLGIQTDGNDNNLTMADTTTLDAELNTNLNSVKDLFSNSTNGIATQVNGFITRAIGDNGSIVQKQTNLTKQSTDIDTQVAALETKITNDTNHWDTEFQAMEQAESTINNNLAYLNRQFPAN
jgi:flagellar hook-associated protein 2